MTGSGIWAWQPYSHTVIKPYAQTAIGPYNLTAIGPYSHIARPEYTVCQVEDGWKWDFGLAAIPSVILLGGFLLCPESPRYTTVQASKVHFSRVQEVAAYLSLGGWYNRVRRKLLWTCSPG